MHLKQIIRLLLMVLAAISVVAVNASIAQAKYSLLLNGKSVQKLELKLEGLKGHMKAENGLKIECTSLQGIATANLAADGSAVTGTASLTFEGCVWVGSGKTCIIHDGFEGNGLIKASAVGEVIMPTESEYTVIVESAEFTTILTEGIFCTIPEEEAVSGRCHLLVLNASSDTAVKLSHLLNLNLKLGNSKVSELVSESHITNLNEPSATWGINLVP